MKKALSNQFRVGVFMLLVLLIGSYASCASYPNSALIQNTSAIPESLTDPPPPIKNSTHIDFQEFFYAITAVDYRLTVFIDDWFIQVEQIITAFLNTIDSRDITHIEEHVSSSIVLVSESNLLNSLKVVHLANIMSTAAGDVYLDLNGINATHERKDAYLKTTRSDSGNIQITPLFTENMQSSELEFFGATFYGATIILSFSLTIFSDDIAQGGHRTFDVFVGLEDLQFKIINIV